MLITAIIVYGFISIAFMVRFIVKFGTVKETDTDSEFVIELLIMFLYGVLWPAVFIYKLVRQL